MAAFDQLMEFIRNWEGTKTGQSQRVPVVPEIDSSHLCFNTEKAKGLDQLYCVCPALQLLDQKKD